MINNPNSPTQDSPNSGFPPTPPSNSRRNLWIWILGIVVVVLIIGTIAVFALTRTGSPSRTNTQVTATTTNNTPTAPSATPTTTSGSTGGSTGSSGGSAGSPSGGAVITPSQAITTVSRYYADINARDFNDAYNTWGSAYRKSTSSYQFAKGFDYTRSVSIAINSAGVTVLNDGTAKVPLTIISINTSGSGTVTHTYHGYYIVGIENGVWHLLSANIH